MRRGITLMEVILALAIFVGSLVVISRLVRHGMIAVERARLETTASLLAESKLSEVEARIIPLADSNSVFSDHPDWRWQLSLTDGPAPGLQHVRITVAPAIRSRLARSAASYSFTLDTWMLESDPSSSFLEPLEGPRQ